ncbi:MAG: hypothetical protein RL264_1080 [Bacteroidota bacterium]
MRLWSLSLVFGALMLITSCSSDPYEVDIDNVKLKLSFVNMDSLVYHSNEKELLCHHSTYVRTHNEIMAFSFGHCLGIPLKPDSTFIRKTIEFKEDKYIQRLEKTIEKWNKNQVKSNLIAAFKRLKVHFPKGKVPESIFFINSLFTASVFSTEKEIAIGVERYLGENAQVIKELPGQHFYAWIKKGMDKRYVERDVLAAWLMTNYIEETTENYASEMMRWGKIIFITRQLLPEIDEATILRYDQKQYDWAVNSEKSIWRYLVDKEMLFKTDEETRVHLLNEGPFTIGLPDESPDRIGQFMGYTIVKKYCEENEPTLKELIALPYNTLLQSYK